MEQHVEWLSRVAGRNHPALGILLMTGNADQRERASNLTAIAHDVITKPFSVEALVARESARRLAALGGSDKAARPVPRRRSRARRKNS